MGKKKRLKLERAQEEAQKPQERLPLSKGVVVFGVMLLLSSFAQIDFIIDKESYFGHFSSFMPAWLIEIRYSFSWFQRIVGIFVAFGIFFRMEIARKLAFILGGFTLLTVYWKHSYPVVLGMTQVVEQEVGKFFSLAAGPAITFPNLAPFAFAIIIAVDFIFWGSFFYFFTRPSVRKQFKPDA